MSAAHGVPRPTGAVPSAVAGGVHVQVTGTGPRTLVLLHGFSDNLSTWRRVVPALATDHRVVAIDLPGHGRSTRAWDVPLVAGYCEVVMQVLDELGCPGPVHLVGNSMGAVVAAMCAERYRDRVDRVALIGMPGIVSVPVSWRAAASRPASLALRMALRPVPVQPLQQAFGWLYAHAASPRPGAIDPEAVRSYLAGYADRDRLMALADIARALLADLRTLRLPELLEASPVPRLEILGRHDRLVPARRHRGRDGVVVLPGCGHCPQLDAPDLLLDALLPFFAEQRAAA
jgi:pimeloyl-ACP methyl ester carboxylesterase